MAKMWRTALGAILVLTIGLGAISCASTPAKTSEPAVTPVETPPPPQETPEPVTPAPEATPAPPVEPEQPPAPEPVADSEFQAAQDAIAEAEAADADTYAADDLNTARRDLKDAQDLASTAPDAARAKLQEAIQAAHQARDLATAARYGAWKKKVEDALAQWHSLDSAHWVPDQDQKLTEMSQTALATLKDDFSTGKPLAEAALQALSDAGTELKTKIAEGLRARDKAQAALDEAENADGEIWAPDELESANSSFFEGTAAWKKFSLSAAVDAWNNSLLDAQIALEKAQKELAKKQTEQLMRDTMKLIESASGKTVVDPQDNIIDPTPWDGEQELQKLQPKPLSMVIPPDGTVAVMGEKKRVTYLDEAKSYWSDGVRAMNAGDLEVANEAFLHAQSLISTYLAMAVDKVYTVRLIPDHRDSLWRISEYDDIYGSPWDWPKIWQRNQKLIQNPDLIYPGWQLIIPPQ